MICTVLSIAHVVMINFLGGYLHYSDLQLLVCDENSNCSSPSIRGQHKDESGTKCTCATRS